MMFPYNRTNLGKFKLPAKLYVEVRIPQDYPEELEKIFLNTPFKLLVPLDAESFLFNPILIGI